MPPCVKDPQAIADRAALPACGPRRAAEPKTLQRGLLSPFDACRLLRGADSPGDLAQMSRQLGDMSIV
jgi:hypothetical protein